MQCIKDTIKNINIVIGCSIGCAYCYARINNNRFHTIDDFNNPLFTKDAFVIKVSINNILFSKLVAYGNKIKICDTKIANEYKKYLKDIIKANS